MKCDVCGQEAQSLIGGVGRKLCDWCWAVETRLREDDNAEAYHGAYILCLVLISMLFLFIGMAIGKYIL
jgi:hypothetical protein